MKGTASILLHLFAPNYLMLMLCRIGLGLMVLALVAAVMTATRTLAPLNRGSLALNVAICGFLAAILVPFLVSPAVSRGLLANIRLVLVPGFKFRAGLALLSLHGIAALFIPVAAMLILGVPLDIRAAMLTFALGSFYSGVVQLILPSRYLIFISSLLPLVVVLAFDRFGPFLASWLSEPPVTYTLFIGALAGWGLCFRKLARHEVFKPRYKAASNEEWLYYGAGWLNSQFAERGSSTGSLLLGYSDRLVSRLVRTFFQLLLTPLIALAFMYLIALKDGNAQAQERMIFMDTFLLLILFSVIVANQGYGELAARCRLLWLRHGCTRERQWNLLEGMLFSNLGLGLLFSAGPLLVVFLLSKLSGILLIHGIVLIVIISLFSAYFRIYSRLRNRAVLEQHIIVGFICVLLGAALLTGIWRGSWSFLLVCELVLIVLSCLARRGAKRDFAAVDWLRVRPSASARTRLQTLS